MSSYNPLDWYWSVAGSTAQVYSSAVGDYVATDNAAYLAWKANDNLPTNIASDVELGEVLAQYQIRPAAAAVLDSYKDIHSKKITIEVVAKLLLWVVNEIRTLKGQPTISAGQFRAFVKGLM